VAEDEANQSRASTTLSEFYDVHRNAPTELAHDPRRSFASPGPGMIQRSPSASRGHGGRGQGGCAPSCNARGHHAQQGGGAGRPRQVPVPARGSESQARPPALHIHLWLDHVEAFPGDLLAQGKRLLTKEARGLPAAVRGAKRASTPSMLHMTSHVSFTTPRAGKRPTPRVSAGS
jgi:hypothetical protein